MPAPLSVLEQIAREELRIETLESRRSDSLDFHDAAVWTVQSALDRAFDYGQREVFKERGCPAHEVVSFDAHADQRQAIAREHLFFETLETRKSDSLDFKDVSVWGVQEALNAAVDAGTACAQQTLAAEQAPVHRKATIRRPGG